MPNTSSPPRQIPFPPAAGFLAEATPPVIRCRGCTVKLPPLSTVCPVCGCERSPLAGRPYPGADLSRFRWVREQDIESGSAKSVLAALAYHDMPDGDGIFPEIDTLAEATGYSPRTIKRALKWLEGHGWIVREQRRYAGRQTTNRYWIMQAEVAAAEILKAGRATG